MAPASRAHQLKFVSNSQVKDDFGFNFFFRIWNIHKLNDIKNGGECGWEIVFGLRSTKNLNFTNVAELHSSVS